MSRTASPEDSAASRPASRRLQAEAYAELCVTSNFTFLTGASHPEELVTRSTELTGWAGRRATSPSLASSSPASAPEPPRGDLPSASAARGSARHFCPLWPQAKVL
ncbi:hypothetical protein FAZ78_19140 [Cereibacter changlensis]|uniref:Uncharacterized protein n=1 Tax=Cereibacter changlensis TaxID=402884 RepID=A0A4U0YTE3_9RHOB|nr:hypothetical protein [Cereibacter changlensis]TKA95015.1 hypothetical protein FAZ78_19140 [Cereibacter changlensis]